jgi:hypothetical protein
VGWPITKEEGGTYDTNPDRDITQRLQAAYVCRQYAFSMRLGVERVHIMYITDADNFNGAFFNSDRTYRESAYAVKNMISLMPHPKLMGALSDGAQGYYAYQFDPNVQVDFTVPVIMAWNVAGPKNVELSVADGNYRVYDMLGDTSTVIAAGGKLAVEAGPCPIYVIKEGSSGIRHTAYSNEISNLKVTQNPFSDQIRFTFSLSGKTDIRLDIFNVNGQVLHAGLYKYVRPGKKTITWDLSDRSTRAGSYFYSFTHQGSQKTGKLVNFK